MIEVLIQLFDRRDDGKWREWNWADTFPVLPRIGESFAADLEIGDEIEEGCICRVTDITYHFDTEEWYASITADLESDCLGNAVRPSPERDYLSLE